MIHNPEVPGLIPTGNINWMKCWQSSSYDIEKRKKRQLNEGHRNSYQHYWPEYPTAFRRSESLQQTFWPTSEMPDPVPELWPCWARTPTWIRSGPRLPLPSACFCSPNKSWHLSWQGRQLFRNRPLWKKLIKNLLFVLEVS